MLQLNDQQRDHLRSMLYLFLIDPARLLSDNKRPEEYEEEEPGYLTSLLNAYQKAWEKDIHHEMSHDLLKTIHREAMRHTSSMTPGQYKKQCNHYTLYTNATPNTSPKNCRPTASIEGFKQLIQKWMYDVDTKIHEIDIIVPGDLETLLGQSRKLVIHKEQLQVRTSHDEIPGQGPSRFIALYDETQIEPFLYALEHSGPVFDSAINTSGDFHLCFVNSMLDYLVSSDPQQFSKTLTNQLDDVFLSYHLAIRNARSEDEKIHVIAQHVQWIDQIHPFTDGNIRTCYILLNRLLKEEGLAMTLLLDPNRFDGFSVEELVKYIKEGQGYATALFNERIPSFEQDEYMAPFVIAGFQKAPIVPIRLKEEKTAAFEAFMQILTHSPMPEILIDALKKKYKLVDLTEPSLGRALRNAAANNRVDDLQFILQHFKLNIDIQDNNPQSQKTALFIAAERGHQASIDILLAAGANPMVRVANGQTPQDMLLALKMKVVQLQP